MNTKKMAFAALLAASFLTGEAVAANVGLGGTAGVSGAGNTAGGGLSGGAATGSNSLGGGVSGSVTGKSTTGLDAGSTASTGFNAADQSSMKGLGSTGTGFFSNSGTTTQNLQSSFSAMPSADQARVRRACDNVNSDPAGHSKSMNDICKKLGSM